MKSIVQQIFEYAEHNPEKLSLHNGKQSLNYDQLLAGICSARNTLSRVYGIGKGDKVIISADKQIEFVFVYFACHLLGAVTLPIAPDTNENRYNLIKKKINPSLVIGFNDESENLKKTDLSEFVFDGIRERCDTITFPNLDSVADIIFTTGTTGEPKGVLLSQRNIAAAARNINGFIGNQENDVEMIVLPISHSFGLGRMRCALSNGQTLIMLGGFANIKRFFRVIEECGVNGFGMVPASWALIKKLSGETIKKYQRQLNYIEIGSAPMPIEEKKRLIEILPQTRICMHYGLTEASRSAFMEFHEESDHLNTIGKQSPNMHITIRDEYGKEVDNGEEGEICVSGDAVTIGYLDIPKEQSFWNDSFRTGDWGLVDKDGYIYLRSRKKELINVGGKKVSPVEIEDVLNGFDLVTDCACIGVKDPEGILGEVVKAYVVTDCPDEITRDKMDILIGNSLEAYKHPFVYEIIDKIPKTSSGKIQRLALK